MNEKEFTYLVIPFVILKSCPNGPSYKDHSKSLQFIENCVYTSHVYL